MGSLLKAKINDVPLRDSVIKLSLVEDVENEQLRIQTYEVILDENEPQVVEYNDDCEPGADNSVTSPVHSPRKDFYIGVSSAQKEIVNPLSVKKERLYAQTAGAIEEGQDVASTDEISPFEDTISAKAKKSFTVKNRSNFKRISFKLGGDESNIASSRGSKDAQLSLGGNPRRLSKVSDYKRAVVPPRKINSAKFSMKPSAQKRISINGMPPISQKSQENMSIKKTYEKN